MDISALATDDGILSGLQKGFQPQSSYTTIQDNNDRLSFCFGLPYVFSRSFSARNSSGGGNCLGVVVLKGQDILERNDLAASFVDRGLIYLNFNPLSALILAQPSEFSSLHPTPLEIFYEYILADPQRTIDFQTDMRAITVRYQLSPRDLPGYLIEFLARSFPLAESDIILAQRWRGTYGSEGSVSRKIPLRSIKSVIVSDHNFATARNITQGMDITLVNAGPALDVVHTAEDGKPYTHNNVNLLTAYLDNIEATEADAFKNLFLKGHVGSHSLWIHKNRANDNTLEKLPVTIENTSDDARKLYEAQLKR